MAQVTDRNIGANPTGFDMRTEINNIIAALESDNSGSSEPLNTVAYMKWLDTSNDTYYYYKERNHDNTAWVTLFRYTVATKIMEVVSNGVVLNDANFVHKTGDETIAGVKTFSSSPIVPNATTATQAIAFGQAVNLTAAQTIAGIKTFSSSPIVPTPTTDMQSANKKYIDDQILLVNHAIEQTTTPILGLIWNQTDDTYKRIGKNINTLTIDGFNEFSAWRSVTAERQNDSDTVSASPFTAWLDTSANLPYSGMKRYVISNTGTEVNAYNADSYTHADQTGITSTQQVMVKIPQFHYIQAKVFDGGKTYHVYLIAKETFDIDFVAELGFTSPEISLWNVAGLVSSGTAIGNVVTSTLHPAFIDNANNVLSNRYYGAFNAVSGRSICGSGVKTTASITRATARTQAQGFGDGFSLIDFFLESAKNILALIEHGTLYFSVGKWRGYDWNTSASANDQDNGKTLSILNKTGVILDGSSRVIANSYRGIENYHSALWRFVDGANSNNYSIYLAKPKATFTDDIIVAPYFDSGVDVVAGASSSYVADHAPGTFIPSTLGGSASTKTCDAAWSATGNTTLLVGGRLSGGAAGGLSAWNSNNASSYANLSIVGRPGL